MIFYIQFKDNYIDGGEDYVTFSACTVNIGNAMCPKVSQYFIKLKVIAKYLSLRIPILLRFAHFEISVWGVRCSGARTVPIFGYMLYIRHEKMFIIDS